MLPAPYATPAAVILVIGGLLACFAGYRLFRLVLGLYGFIFGAAITTSIWGAANPFSLVVAAVVGGLLGAVLMIAAYFVGVGLVGAGLAALALTSGWHAVRFRWFDTSLSLAQRSRAPGPASSAHWRSLGVGLLGTRSRRPIRGYCIRSIRFRTDGGSHWPGSPSLPLESSCSWRQRRSWLDQSVR
jgi:hypothetical protein